MKIGISPYHLKKALFSVYVTNIFYINNFIVGVINLCCKSLVYYYIVLIQFNYFTEPGVRFSFIKLTFTVPSQ